MKYTLLATTLVLSTNLFAATQTKKTESKKTNAIAKEKSPFSGNAQLGITNNTGNSTTTNINGKFVLVFQKNRWKNNAQLSGQYSRSDDKGTTAAQFEVNNQTQYSITRDNTNYWYVSEDYTNNRFDGFRYILNLSSGYGHRMINDQKNGISWDLQIGPGYRIQPIKDSSSSSDQNSTEFTANLGSDFNWNITDKTKLSNNISVSYASRNTIITTGTALTTNVVGNLGLSLNFDTTFTTNPPNEKKKLDTVSSVNLVYTFNQG